MFADFRGKRVLLLQGPNGPFFRRLAQELYMVGAFPQKIHFNAADAFYFWGLEGISYRGSFEDWPAFLDRTLHTTSVDCAFLFGDERPYHRAARPLLEKHGVEVFVFEEGYLRPHHVTIERAGVNRRSPLRRDGAQRLDTYRAAPQPQLGPALAVHHDFAWSVLHTIVNSLFVTLGALIYPHYRHHRDVNTARQALLWARSGLRKFYYSWAERPQKRELARKNGPPYFLFALQVFNDSQIRTSKFKTMDQAILDVVASFASFAPSTTRLVLKHHPADRAYRDYSALVKELALRHGLGSRLLYVHDLHLPSLLQGALGTVVVNSTVGLSSLTHGTPVFALDESIYGYLGLTSTGSLEEFWQRPSHVDRERVQAARHFLEYENQANGSIWAALPGRGPTGLRWPPALGPSRTRSTKP